MMSLKSEIEVRKSDDVYEEEEPEDSTEDEANVQHQK